MRIDIISAVPDLLESFTEHSIIKRARDNKVAVIEVHNLREYGIGNYRQIDDYPYGGEPGMVLMIEPVYNLISKLKSQYTYDAVIYTSPDGKQWTQKTANIFSTMRNIIILCGHYKGIDHRIREHLITDEYSLGDFVMTGGEIAAAAFCDSIVRLLPNAIGDEQSALSDSFQDGLLAPPIYTRPAKFKDWEVPEVLRSGHDAKIQQWKENQMYERTKNLRPDLLK